MLIAGLQKTSFVDYPGKLAAVVFTPYCNFNCTYCHNDHILGRDTELLPESKVLEYLAKRSDILKGVVISGGEPTLQQNLETFIRQARELSYAVKLDTNGSKPEVLQALLKKELLDYVAMDIKAPLSKYCEIARTQVDTGALLKSIALIRNSGVSHEFRMTFAPALTIEDAVQGAMLVKGCERFYLQQYRTRYESDPKPHIPSELHAAQERIQAECGVCVLRGA